MKETVKSDLKSFETEDMDELIAGLGEMTGLDDEQVKQLLQIMPDISGPVCVDDISDLESEKAKGFARCIRVSFANGKSIAVAKRIDGDRFYIGEFSSPAAAPQQKVQFDRVEITGRDLDGAIKTIDDDWDID
jgi:hypothetical protein